MKNNQKDSRETDLPQMEGNQEREEKERVMKRN